MIQVQLGAMIVVLAISLAGATIIDLKVQRIPNGLSAMLLVLGIATWTLADGPSGSLTSVLAAATAFLCVIPLYALGGMCAGDVKLIAAVASCFTPLAAFEMVLSILIYGGVLGAVLLGTRLINKSIGPFHVRFFANLAAMQRFPYASAIAAGTFAIVGLHIHGITLTGQLA